MAIVPRVPRSSARSTEMSQSGVHFFKFKSSEALVTERLGLGLDFHLARELSSLFRPATVGGRTVGNRLAIQPMEGCDAELDGSPGALTFRRFRRFGAGGAKLIWGEACAVVRRTSRSASS